MTPQRDPGDRRNPGARIGEVWQATRQREGLATILAVVVLSALIIAGLSYVLEPSPSAGVKPSPPATYRAQ